MESSETLRDVIADVVKEEDETESRSVESDAAEEIEESCSGSRVERLVMIECGGLGGGESTEERGGEGFVSSRGEATKSSIKSGSIGATDSPFEITLQGQFISKAHEVSIGRRTQASSNNSPTKYPSRRVPTPPHHLPLH